MIKKPLPKRASIEQQKTAFLGGFRFV